MYYRQSDKGYLHYVCETSITDEDDKILKVFWDKEKCIEYMLKHRVK